VAGSFWARPREEESGLTLFTVPASTLTQGEGKGASGGLEVQALCGKGGNEGGESARLQVYAPGVGKSQAKAEEGKRGGLQVSAPAKPEEVQVIWCRDQGEVRGV